VLMLEDRDVEDEDEDKEEDEDDRESGADEGGEPKKLNETGDSKGDDCEVLAAPIGVVAVCAAGEAATVTGARPALPLFAATVAAPDNGVLGVTLIAAIPKPAAAAVGVAAPALTW